MFFLHAINLISLNIFVRCYLEFNFISILLSLAFIIVKLIKLLFLFFLRLWFFALGPKTIVCLISVIEILDKWVLFMYICCYLLIYVSILYVLLILLCWLVYSWVFIMSYFFFSVKIWRFIPIIILRFVKIYSSFR